MGKWGMQSGVNANEKQDGGNEKYLRSTGDPLQTPYRPKILLLYTTFYTLNFAAANYPAQPGILLVGNKIERLKAKRIMLI